MYNAVHSSQESVELIATEFLALKKQETNCSQVSR